MILLYIGAFLISSSWIFLSPIFVQDFFSGLVLYILGLSFISIGLQRYSLHTIVTKIYYLLFSVLVLSSCILPFPYSLPFVVFSIGIFLLILNLQIRLLKLLALGCIFSGFISIFHVLFLLFYFKLSTRLVTINEIAYPTYFLLKIFGIEAYFDKTYLFIRGIKSVFTFSNNIEKFGLYNSFNIFIAFTIIILTFIDSNKFSAFLRIIFYSVFYLILRYAALIVAYNNFLSIGIFLNPWVNVISYLPFTIFIYYFFPIDPVPKYFSIELAPSQMLNSFSLPIFILTFLGSFLIVGSWGYNDPGKVKRGQILIDEKHSNWEWTTDKFDKTTFGPKAAYNYYCLSNYLNHFYSVKANFSKLNRDILKQIDVLIIKMPTESFYQDEIQAIEDFVENGGGLYLIGDHTNVFGTSGYLNPLSEKFGVRFNYDATYDLRTGNLSLYEPPKLLAHPVVMRLPSFLFGSSCSLNCSFLVEDVMTGYQLRSADLDYSQKNFFPEQINSPIITHGLFLQACAAKFGKGRVLAFSDSTVFSNFWIFMPGKAELLLKSVDWLNRKNSKPTWFNLALFISGISVIIIAIVITFLRNSAVQGLIIILCTATLSTPFFAYIFHLHNSLYYTEPRAKSGFQKVYFDLKLSNMSLPVRNLVSSTENSYENFFILPQRIGYVPKAIDFFEDGLEAGSILVVINPKMALTEKKRNLLMKFIEDGGRLLILDSRCNVNSSSNFLLEPLNVNLVMDSIKTPILEDTIGRSMLLTDCASIIEGGIPVLTTKSNETIVAKAYKGKGIVIIVSESQLFCDRSIGTTMGIPNSNQKLILELGFWIFEELLSAQK